LIQPLENQAQARERRHNTNTRFPPSKPASRQANQQASNPSSAIIHLKTPREALALFGENDQNLKRLRTRLEAKILARGDSIRIEGEASHVKIAEGLIRDLLAVVRQGGSVTLEEVDRGAKVSSDGGSYLEDISTHIPGESVLELPKRLKPKTKGQKIYVDAIMSNEITFGIGPVAALFPSPRLDKTSMLTNNE
jgi:phosphate starvation-inducible protein PhoH and related proteins